MALLSLFQAWAQPLPPGLESLEKRLIQQQYSFQQHLNGVSESQVSFCTQLLGGSDSNLLQAPASSDELAPSPPPEETTSPVLYQFRVSSTSKSRPQEPPSQPPQAAAKNKRPAKAAGDVRGAHAPLKKRRLVSVLSIF